MAGRLLISDEGSRQMVSDAIAALDLSHQWEVDVRVFKRDRSAEQNRLAFEWYKHVAGHFGDRTVEEVRAQMKLEIGVPILRRDDEGLRELYDKYLKPLPYEAKLALIEKLDIPVTRNMNVPQMTEYLDTMHRYWAQQGVVLPLPEER